jgi:hypothetical protein
MVLQESLLKRARASANDSLTIPRGPLWSFWIVVSRQNHPNLRLNAIASGVLVATFSGAAYLNHFWMIPVPAGRAAMPPRLPHRFSSWHRSPSPAFWATCPAGRRCVTIVAIHFIIRRVVKIG